jgi:hypothetical protein
MNNPVSKLRARKNTNHTKNHPSTSKPIVRISNNGELKQYTSINDAVRDGFSRTGISRCCNKHTTFIGGIVGNSSSSPNRTAFYFLPIL